MNSGYAATKMIQRGSAPVLFNAANRSLKSGFTVIGSGPCQVLQSEVPQGFHSGLGGLVSQGIRGEPPLILVEVDHTCGALAPSFFGSHASILPF